MLMMLEQKRWSSSLMRDHMANAICYILHWQSSRDQHCWHTIMQCLLRKTGLQKLKRSDKRSDPFKVGKFGIGFNSVFHVTGVHNASEYGVHNTFSHCLQLTIVGVHRAGSSKTFNNSGTELHKCLKFGTLLHSTLWPAGQCLFLTIISIFRTGGITELHISILFPHYCKY